MNSTVIALLVVLAFASGIGVGLVMLLRPSPERRRQIRQEEATAARYREYAKRLREQKAESEVYFGRDDNDHPDDIERQGSLFPQRDPTHRYDGMADGDAPYVPSGLDFANRPR
jgi:hypothetical protein